MIDGYSTETMHFDNDFEMAWYLDDLSKRVKYKATNITRTKDGIYLVIRQYPKRKGVTNG